MWQREPTLTVPRHAHRHAWHERGREPVCPAGGESRLWLDTGLERDVDTRSQGGCRPQGTRSGARPGRSSIPPSPSHFPPFRASGAASASRCWYNDGGARPRWLRRRFGSPVPSVDRDQHPRHGVHLVARAVQHGAVAHQPIEPPRVGPHRAGLRGSSPAAAVSCPQDLAAGRAHPHRLPDPRAPTARGAGVAPQGPQRSRQSGAWRRERPACCTAPTRAERAGSGGSCSSAQRLRRGATGVPSPRIGQQTHRPRYW